MFDDELDNDELDSEFELLELLRLDRPEELRLELELLLELTELDELELLSRPSVLRILNIRLPKPSHVMASFSPPTLRSIFSPG